MKHLSLISLTLLISLTAACDKKSNKRGADVVPTAPTSEQKPTDEQKPMDEQKPVDEQKPSEEKPSEEKPVEKPAEPAKAGANLIGLWQTKCLVLGEGDYADVSYTFNEDGSWSYFVGFYNDIGCTNLVDNITFDGKYKVGKTLANDTIELDFTNIQWFLVYKIDNNTLQMSDTCDQEDIMDANDTYCYGRPTPIGVTAESRSLELSTLLSFTKK